MAGEKEKKPSTNVARQAMTPHSQGLSSKVGSLLKDWSVSCMAMPKHKV